MQALFCRRHLHMTLIAFCCGNCSLHWVVILLNNSQLQRGTAVRWDYLRQHSSTFFSSMCHDILCQVNQMQFDKTVSWDSTGAKFFICNQEAFVSRVLAEVLNQTKFSSFAKHLSAHRFGQTLNLQASTKISIHMHQNFCTDDPGTCAKTGRRHARDSQGVSLDNLAFRSSTVEPERDLIPSSTTQPDCAASGVPHALKDAILNKLTEPAFDSTLDNCGVLDQNVWNPILELLSNGDG